MTGDVNFSGKLAKKIDLSAITVEGMEQAKKEEIEKIFNTVTGGTSANTLTTDELVVLSDTDTDHDGKITDAEARAAYDKLADNVKQALTEKQVTQNDYVAYLKAMAKKNEEMIAQENNVGNSYVIQLGEDLDDLVDRVIAANGIPDDKKAEAKTRYKAAILAANKSNGAIKFDGNGNVKWLVAGQKIIIPTMTEDERSDKRVKNQDNRTAVENKYRAWRAGKIGNFRYSIDENGQASEVRASGRTNFDITKDYDSKTGQQQGVAQDEDPNKIKPEDVDTKTLVDFDKVLTDENLGDYKDKKDEVKTKTEKANDILNQMKDPDKIDDSKTDVGETNDGYVVTVTTKDGNEIQVYYDEKGDLEHLEIKFKGSTTTDVGYYSSGNLDVDMDDSNNSWEVTLEGAFDFNKIKALVPQSVNDKVKELVSPSAESIVDISAGDYGDYDEAAVDARIKEGTDVLEKLKDKDNIKSIGEVEYDSAANMYNVTIELKDGSIVKVQTDADGKLQNVYVDLDGKSVDGQKHDELMFAEDGVRYAFENNADWEDPLGIGTVDMDKLEKILPKDALDALKAKTASAKATDIYALTEGELKGHDIKKVREQVDKVNDVLSGLSSAEVTVEEKNPIIAGSLVKTFVVKIDDKTSIKIDVARNLNAQEEEYSINSVQVIQDGKVAATYKSDGDMSVNMNGTVLDLRGAVNFDEIQKMIFANTTIKDALDKSNVKQITTRREDGHLENGVEKYRADGEDLGHKLYDEVEGSSDVDKEKELINKINEHNAYWVVKTFSQDAKDDDNSIKNIIEYLDDERIKGQEIAHVIDSILRCAALYGLKNNPAYEELEAHYEYYAVSQKDTDVDNASKAKDVDKAINKLMPLIEEAMNEQAPPSEVSEPEFNINSVYLKTSGNDLGDSLYDEVSGSSDNDKTAGHINNITPQNVYYVLTRFNEKTTDEPVIEFLDRESGLKGENVYKILDNLLKCAKNYGLDNTSVYHQLKTYMQHYERIKDEDMDDTEYAAKCDAAVKELLGLIKQEAGIS